MVAVVISRALGPAIRRLTPRQQRKAMLAALGAGIATEGSLQLLGLSPWRLGSLSGWEVDCGSYNGDYIPNRVCTSVGSVSNIGPETLAGFLAQGPSLNPSRTRIGVGTFFGYTGIFRQYYYNATLQRTAGTSTAWLPATVGFQQPIATVPDVDKPGVMLPPWVGNVPGLISKPGEPPWSPPAPPISIPGIIVGPRPETGGKPIVVETPVSPPYTKPGETELYPTRTPYRVGFIPRAIPASNVRETKVAFSPMGVAPAITQWLDQISEVSDVIDAIYRALPPDVRSRYKAAIDAQGDAFGGIGGGGRQSEGAIIKLRAIYNNHHRLDAEQMAANLFDMWAQDMAVGLTEGNKGRLFSRIRGE